MSEIDKFYGGYVWDYILAGCSDFLESLRRLPGHLTVTIIPEFFKNCKLFL